MSQELYTRKIEPKSKFEEIRHEVRDGNGEFIDSFTSKDDADDFIDDEKNKLSIKNMKNIKKNHRNHFKP